MKEVKISTPSTKEEEQVRNLPSPSDKEEEQVGNLPSTDKNCDNFDYCVIFSYSSTRS